MNAAIAAERKAPGVVGVSGLLAGERARPCLFSTESPDLPGVLQLHRVGS